MQTDENNDPRSHMCEITLIIIEPVLNAQSHTQYIYFGSFLCYRSGSQKTYEFKPSEKSSENVKSQMHVSHYCLNHSADGPIAIGHSLINQYNLCVHDPWH